MEGESQQLTFSNFKQALSRPDTSIRLFGKPEVSGRRRMGVALARTDSVEEAKSRAIEVVKEIKIEL